MNRTPEEHAQAVRELFPPRPTETVDTAAAASTRARLASDVTATHDQPGFDNSQMDGYATARLDAHAADVGPTIPAGTDPDELYPDGIGEFAAPIMTGAKIPQGTRAIIPVERCRPDTFLEPGSTVELPSAPDGQFIRRAGSDIAAGTVIAAAGTEVTPALFGALLAQSITRVEVARTARILVVTGGAEVSGRGSATIVDTNGPMLEVLAARHGIEVAGRLLTDDSPDRLAADLSRAVREHAPDAIVTSGGISQGKFEVVRQVLSDGWYGHVAQQPGGPQGLSRWVGVPVVSLPGNPISTLVSFRLYVAPVLGHAPAPVRAPLDKTVAGLDGKEQFLRGELVDGHARPVGKAGSHLLAQAATADCLIRVPAGAQLAEGDSALVYPL